MAEDRPTRAEKKQWEAEWLELLEHYLKHVVPPNPAAAVADHMIEIGDIEPHDLIEDSKTDRRAWDVLQRLVLRLRAHLPPAVAQLPPLGLWVLDVADGTRLAPPRGRGRPPMIEKGNLEPHDLIEASKTDRRAWDVLQRLVRRLRAHLPPAVAQLPPLGLWVLDVADGTRLAPPRGRGRPSKGYPLFRDMVIARVIDEIVAIGLRGPTSSKTGDPFASACHLVAAHPMVSQEYTSVRNLWQRQSDETNK